MSVSQVPAAGRGTAMIRMAVGLAVLYRKRTGPIATTLLSIYAVIALIVAFVRS